MTKYFFSGALLSCIAFAANAQDAKRYNILYIMSDDHSFQTISAYNHILGKYAQTKNIDRIAKDGVLFERAYVANSICSPARATLLTGQHSHMNGKYTNRGGFDYNVNKNTLPELLQQNGYQTAIIGKWHLTTTPKGFDYSDVLIGQGLYYNPVFIKNGGKKHTVKGYNTDITGDIALNWFKEQRKTEKPFAMFLHFKAAHRSFSPATRHLNLFNDCEIPMPENYFDNYSTRGKPLEISKMSVARDFTRRDLKVDFTYDNIQIKKLPEEYKIWTEHYKKENAPYINKTFASKKDAAKFNYQRYMKDYLRVIRALDENIGRVLDYLEQANLADDTVIIYTSDQGFYMGEHGWFDKRYMFEESYRTPLLIRVPGNKNKGVKNHNLVQNIDYAPTILDFANIKIPAEMQGVSLKKLLDKGEVAEDQWRDSLYYHYYETQTAHKTPRHDGVSTKRWKLINFYELKEWQLFDLKNDPSEMNNIYNDPQYATVIKELKGKYAQLKKHYHVPEEIYSIHAGKLKSYK
ncbi:sulfatase [Lentisphaerota bacterium WC36G]|nr:sulfatase [Lentisphaerae bacterium WC36]